MALRANIAGGIFNSPINTTIASNARFTQAQAFGTPAAQVYSRSSINPGPGNLGVINMMPQSTIRFNGNPITNPALQAGNFMGGVYYNLADNSLTNSYNLSRAGLNYDIRTARGGFNNSFPPFLRRPTYQNGQPYLYPSSEDFRGPIPDYPLGYVPAQVNRFANGERMPSYYPYPYLNFPTAYGNSNEAPYNYNGNWSYFVPNYDYPLTAPECSQYVNCANYANPNDCRSCVSIKGGPRHCANQICGAPNL